MRTEEVEHDFVPENDGVRRQAPKQFTTSRKEDLGRVRSVLSHSSQVIFSVALAGID